ncbi:hypothetical protein LXL04_002347 [Taraxacum kok-saghyz]
MLESKLKLVTLWKDSFENPRGQDYGHGDLEMGTQNNPNTAKLGLVAFFKKVSLNPSFFYVQAIEKQYEKLNKLLKKLQVSSLSLSHSFHTMCDAHEGSKAVTKAAAMKAIKKRMAKDVDEVGKIARFIKSKIEELDREVRIISSYYGRTYGYAVAVSVGLIFRKSDDFAPVHTLQSRPAAHSLLFAAPLASLDPTCLLTAGVALILNMNMMKKPLWLEKTKLHYKGDLFV